MSRKFIEGDFYLKGNLTENDLKGFPSDVFRENLQIIFISLFQEEDPEAWNELYKEVFPFYIEANRKREKIIWKDLTDNEDSSMIFLKEKIIGWCKKLNLNDRWVWEKILWVLELWYNKAKKYGETNYPDGKFYFKDILDEMGINEIPISELGFYPLPFAIDEVDGLGVEGSEITIPLPAFTWDYEVETKEEFKERILKKLGEIIDKEIDENNRSLKVPFVRWNPLLEEKREVKDMIKKINIQTKISKQIKQIEKKTLEKGYRKLPGKNHGILERNLRFLIQYQVHRVPFEQIKFLQDQNLDEQDQNLDEEDDVSSNKSNLVSHDKKANERGIKEAANLIKLTLVEPRPRGRPRKKPKN